MIFNMKSKTTPILTLSLVSLLAPALAANAAPPVEFVDEVQVRPTDGPYLQGCSIAKEGSKAGRQLILWNCDNGLHAELRNGWNGDFLYMHYFLGGNSSGIAASGGGSVSTGPVNGHGWTACVRFVGNGYVWCL